VSVIPTVTLPMKLDMIQIVKVLRATAKHLSALADDLEES
jgi:hypothetical protein